MRFPKDFLNFIKEYQIMGLAIAFVIGVATKDLVSATVDDLVMPIISVFLGGGNWETATLDILGVHFRIGHFLGALIDFLIVALLLFLFIRYILGREELQKTG